MRLEYKYVVALVAVFGTCLNVLDGTIANVAVPALERDFGASTDTVQWVVTAYPISLAMFLPFSGWAGDRFGTRRIFILSMALFVASSALCASAWTIHVLIAFRVVQGMAGGLLVPMSATMVFRAFPPAERAKASSITVAPVTLASAMGPVIGGALIDSFSWHWIFLINLPLGGAGIILAALLLKEQREPNPGRIDVPGFLLAASGLASLLFGLTRAGNHDLADPGVLLASAAGTLLLAAFVLFELRASQPMVDLRLLRNRLFAACSATALAGFAAFSALLFLLPLMLQVGRGLSAFESGLTVLPQSIAVFCCAPFAGRFFVRFGPRRLLAGALLLMSVTAFCFTAIGFDSPLWQIWILMAIRGVGLGAMVVGLQAGSFATIAPPDTGRASAINSIAKQVGSSFGVAVVATVLTSRLAHYGVQLGGATGQGDALRAVHETFLAAGVVTLIAAAVALAIRDSDAAVSMQARTRRRPLPEAPVPEAAVDA